CHANDHVKAGFTGVIRQEVTLKGVVTQTRAKNPATRGFLSDGWRHQSTDDYIDYFAVSLRLIGVLALILTSCGLAAINADDIWY
ncbi:hypothetical protein MJL22_28025, partial [Salmonella enterica subsp. enterica serovar Montevideo]|nr:hypothetical protein [Salmonella enterica subsp. enterica serovar Montevideo]